MSAWGLPRTAAEASRPAVEREPEPRCRGIVRAWPTRLLLLILVFVLVDRWSDERRRAVPTAFKHCDAVWPILVGTHHKTGTVLLQVRDPPARRRLRRTDRSASSTACRHPALVPLAPQGESHGLIPPLPVRLDSIS